MNDKEIIAVMAEVYNRLYNTSFHGEQVHIISDCMKMLMSAIVALNQGKQTQQPDDDDNKFGSQQ